MRDAQNAEARIQRQLDQKQEAFRLCIGNNAKRNAPTFTTSGRRLNRQPAACGMQRRSSSKIELTRCAMRRKKAAHVVLELFLGVLDGSVRPRPDNPRIWIIRDDDLRERAKKLGLIELVKDTMKVLHDAWMQLAERLSPSEKAASPNRLRRL